jgi:hypothetical protein
MRRRLTTALVFTLGLGVTFGLARLPDGDGCAVPAASAAASSGCCHYNKGVCGCEGGRARCCDGKVSASCRCPAVITRQATIPTEPMLRMADVAFAGQQAPEPPSPRLTTFRLANDPLWFWFRIVCNDECWSQLAVNDALPLEIRWLFDPGSGPVLEGQPQALTLPRNRLAGFVSRPPGQLRLGRWETEVRFDTERLCLHAPDEKCWFQIQVQR